MAEERRMDTASKVTTTAAPKPAAKPAASKAPAKPVKPAVAKPGQASVAAGPVAQLRADLSAARRDLALQKLDSPAKIRKLRKDLARALTAERATQLKETA